MKKEMISLVEATRRLRVDRRTILRWVKRGRLGLHRDHRGWAFLKATEVNRLAWKFGFESHE